MTRKSISFWLIILTALFLFVLLRGVAINADAPAADISRSGVFLADEGLHGYNALHWALTGHWYVEDDINHGVNSPVFMIYEYALLKGFGISLATVRYGAVGLGMFSLLILFIILVRERVIAGWIVLVLGVFNYPLLIYQRLALLENCLLLLLLLAFYCLYLFCRSGARRKEMLAAFWIAFFAALLVKSTALFMLPLFCFTLIYYKSQFKKTVLISLFMIVLLTGFIWFVHIRYYVDDWIYYQSLYGLERITTDPLQLIKHYGRFFAHLKLYAFMPLLYTVAVVAVFYNLYNWTRRNNLDLSEKLFTLWLLSGMAFLGLFAYSPPRYSLILFPAILALNGLFFNRIAGKTSVSVPRAALLAVAILTMSQIGFGVYRILEYDQLYLSCFLPVLGLVPILLFLFVLRKNPFKTLLLLGIFVFLVQSIQIVVYFSTLNFSLSKALAEMNRELDDEEGGVPVLCGDSSLLAAFELRCKAVDIMLRRQRLPALISRTQPRYLFLEDPSQLDYLQNIMPDYFRHVNLLGHWTIMNNYLHHQDAVLYRIEPR